MPFQLYPQLPAGRSDKGVVKDELFGDLIKQRYPGATEEMRLSRVKGLAQAWKAEGLELKSPPTGLNAGGGGRMGSSFDSQRLILLAREQGCEDAMIEEVYSANHSRDECLSDWSVLLGCAKRAGVKGAEVALSSGWGVKETVAKIEEYKAMGVTAVPVVVVDSIDATPIKSVLSSGAPETDFIRETLAHLAATSRLPWATEQQELPSPQPRGLPSPQPPTNWTPTAPKPRAEPMGEPASGTRGGGKGEGGGKGGEGGAAGSAALARVLSALDANGSPNAGEACAAAPRKGEKAVNVLAGSLTSSSARPHQLTIDADFVTCTQ